MAVSQTLELTLLSQSVTSNYSVVRMVWKSTQSGESWNGNTRTGYYYVSKNGGAETTHSVSYTLPKNSTKTIVSADIVVPHNSDGTGSIKVRTWMDTDIYAGVVEQSKTLALPTIPRQSKLTAGNGTLGVAQTLQVAKQADGFTHTITYRCGNASGTICTQSGDSNISWTAPIELAEQAPSANSVTVTFTITTYSGNTSVGSSSASAVFAIPNTNAFIPVLLPSLSDAMGYIDTYGGLVQGKSKLKVDITTYGAYGAWITSVQTVFEGSSYMGTDVTTNPIVGSGTLPVKIKVTDSRGRTSTSETTVTVMPYAFPKITGLSVVRCDANGNPNPSGSYLLAKFGATLSGLNNKNTARYFIGYKKTTETDHTAVEQTNLTGKYSVTDATYVIPAEPASSYTVIFTVIDAFKTTTVVVNGPAVAKVWSLLKKAGKIVGAAIGKIAELEDVFEIAYQTRFTGGLLHSVLETRTDLNTLLTPTTYMLLSANTYTNTPESGVGGFLEIVGIKDSSLIQRYSVFDNVNHRTYERIHYATTGWGDWICIRGDFVVEQGTSNGWTYRKWNSGVAECWKILTHKTAITTAWGALYHGTATTRQQYPFGFSDKPTEHVSLTAGSYQAILFPEKDGNGVNGSSASACYNVCRPSSMATAMEFYISFYVKGKWK